MEKDSFILYTSYKDILQDLTYEEMGIIFRAILEYQDTGKIIDLPKALLTTFRFIKNQLDMDKNKWEQEKQKRSDAGKKGMQNRWDKSTTNDKSVISVNNKNNSVISGITKITDNVNVNDNVNDNVNVIKDNKYISSEQQVATEPKNEKESEKVDEIVEMVEAEEIKTTPNELQGLNLYENDKRLVKLWPELLSAWKTAFPGIDVVAEVKAAHAWEVANPKRRKVDKARFLQNWMSRAQDKSGSIIGARSNKSTSYDFN